MGAVTTLPRSRPLTVADLAQMPEDGHRYELIDGALVVTPAPSWEHQRASLRIGARLLAACPEGLEVLAAPFDVVLAKDTLVQPDLIVGHRADFTSRALRVAPVLAVEILSPSTRLYDLNLKLARYEQAGVLSYWVVDPASGRMLVWWWRDGRFEQVADVAPEQAYETDRPYSVTIPPSVRRPPPASG